MRIATTHTNTDFDALASLVAATFLYPGTLAILPSQIRPNVRAFLSLHQDLFHIVPRKGFELDAVEQLVVVDANNWGRLDRMKELKNRDGLNIQIWDHHMKGGNIKANFLQIQNIGANVTQMLETMKARDCAFSPMHATLFLLGIYDDTGNLSYPSVTPRDAVITGFLLENGADLNVASAYLFSSFDDGQTDILTQMLGEDEVFSVGGFQVAVCNVGLECGSTMLAPVVTKYKEIKGVDAVFGVFQLDSHSSIVIARSGHPDLDVGQIILSLGGGGHPAAGSAMIKSGDVSTLYTRVCDLVQEMDRPKMTVEKIMSDKGNCLEPDTKLEEAATILKKERLHAALVVDKGKCLGILSQVEMSKLKRASQFASPVKAFMRRNLPTIGPGQGIKEALELLSDTGVPLLPVLRKGELIGKVTRTDLMLQIYDLT
ncbi:nanoRNase/pAp phosphatase, hydrolyzes c-di-AMP and oligoRNAs [Desulfocicer vacuolatum DSM 3385]|uniref:NanoRNase/pAp phosphatase, hydrolyzes c-di-AMP and oligoRNAs n=1 Tax=Desulfocicer vacuolatum DSM 3385 TaxID=1121400 RepID=A0A1W2D315_9BACT|nr:CBS domain-containing protein [Desulfocicer vacuolatum]SMC91873.1 nanoRNase/pAp phosphatase, hydrolyzes c-di-AMP and oligoRNAs [Desulfocicer vacuolatum DSM 3385]